MFRCCCSANGQAVSSRADAVDERAIVKDMGGGGGTAEHQALFQFQDAPRAAAWAGAWNKRDGMAPQVMQSSRLTSAAAAQHAMRPNPRERTLVIQRDPGDSPGLDVDLVDGVHALVVAIRPGAFQKWNVGHPDDRILPNDRIVEVNGKRGDVAEIIAQLREQFVWSVKLQRPFEFECTLARKSTSSLGLDLRYAPGGTSLAICGMGPGPALEWNALPGNAGRTIGLYDRIVELNGCRGAAPQLLAASEGVEHLRMKVLKYGQ